VGKLLVSVPTITGLPLCGVEADGWDELPHPTIPKAHDAKIPAKIIGRLHNLPVVVGMTSVGEDFIAILLRS
jgi:hypothetical protein